MATPPNVKKNGRGKKAKSKPAQAPAQGPIGNTSGVITPKVDPNTGGSTTVPSQPETPEEADFLENQMPEIKQWTAQVAEQTGGDDFPTVVVGALVLTMVK